MKQLIRNLRSAWTRFRDHEGPRIAASLAFYILFSSVPAVALLVPSIGWAIRDPHEQAHVLGHMLEIIPVGSMQNRTFLMNSVRAIREATGGLTVLSAIGLAWSGLGMFGAARWGLNRAWGVQARSSILRMTLMDFAVAVGIWLMLLISAVGTAAIHIVTGESAGLVGSNPVAPALAWSAAQWTVPALLSFCAFLFLYRYVPNVTHGMRDVLPATLIATGFFEVSKYLFGLYVSLVSSHSPLYSALGGILGFMLWVYVGAIILLLGAEFASVHQQQRAGIS